MKRPEDRPEGLKRTSWAGWHTNTGPKARNMGDVWFTIDLSCVAVQKRTWMGQGRKSQPVWAGTIREEWFRTTGHINNSAVVPPYTGSAGIQARGKASCTSGGVENPGCSIGAARLSGYESKAYAPVGGSIRVNHLDENIFPMVAHFLAALLASATRRAKPATQAPPV